MRGSMEYEVVQGYDNEQEEEVHEVQGVEEDECEGSLSDKDEEYGMMHEG